MENTINNGTPKEGREAAMTNYQIAKEITKGTSPESKYFYLQAMLKEGFINKHEYMDLINPNK